MLQNPNRGEIWQLADGAQDPQLLCQITGAVPSASGTVTMTVTKSKTMSIGTGICALALCAGVAAPAAHAQSFSDVIPAQGTHCTLAPPPAQAGIAVTPGGFVLVFPRNDAITDRYTGCKQMWVVDGTTMRRFATLYFKNGTLAVAAAHDVRDSAGTMTAACAFPEGKSLLPSKGQQASDAGCKGFSGDAFYALRLPTWPRSCMTDTRAAVCLADPR